VRTPLLLALLGLLLLMLCIGGMWLMRHVAHSKRLASRIQRVQGIVPTSDGADSRKDSSHTLVRVIAQIGGAITRSGVLPSKTLIQLEETLLTSGFHTGNALGLFVGTKVILLVSLPVLVALLLPDLGLSRMSYLIAIGGAACIGLLAPDYIIGKIRQKHLSQVELGLPDALDMMVICTEAGLGLEPAIVRVSAEILHVHPALANELDRTSSELQVASDTRTALLNMGTRTGLESLRRLGTTLIQTMQYGTPLSSALRVLSSELRRETLTKFEERAARLPVLLTMPMILFILPCVFLVVGGPAIIQLMKVMR
jgi:tight adherence protein C